MECLLKLSLHSKFERFFFDKLESHKKNERINLTNCKQNMMTFDIRYAFIYFPKARTATTDAHLRGLDTVSLK